jgi:hypothetical protein
MEPGDLWAFLPLGYALTVALETPVLLLGLSPVHSWSKRFIYGFWLTACTYPIVVLVLPMLTLGWPRWQYLAIAETFAPLAECLLFYLAERGNPAMHRRLWLRDLSAVAAANVFSFLCGELIFSSYPLAA